MGKWIGSREFHFMGWRLMFRWMVEDLDLAGETLASQAT